MNANNHYEWTEETKLKKIMSLALAYVICFVLLLQSFAANNDILVYVNGQALLTDVTPIIYNGRTLAPMRSLFEAVGAEVTWYPEESKVVANKDDTSIQLIIGDENAIINGKEILLDVQPKIVDGRTLVPLRFVSEALLMDVYWNDFANVILISNDIQDKYDSTGQFIEYRAQIAGNLPNGFGRKYTEAGKLIYEGQFSNGLRNGFGTVYWENGDKYVGSLSNDKISGSGRLIYSTLGNYEGVFSDGLKNGTGTFVWNDGDKYSGSWKNDKMDGIGTYTFKNGDRYEGAWFDNQMDGEGTYYFANGKIFKGTWNNGEQIGGGFVD